MMRLVFPPNILRWLAPNYLHNFMSQSHIGLIGLAVMGSNLARNIADKKFRVTVYNRTTTVTDEFIKNFGSDHLVGSHTLPEFVASLASPRKIILMVKAGDAVDAVIEELTNLQTQNIASLQSGDTIIDCGNSHYRDTERRFKQLKEKGIHFIGSGVSGGEEGALHGPSLMPGGNRQAYKSIEPIWKKIAAKDFSNKPCVTYVGDGGAGHYVKMVHNGIEYGIMQLIAEAYDTLRTVYKLPAEEISKIFAKYNKGILQSYLFEIAAEVLAKRDDLSRGYLIDHIRDTAGQKGTGKWTSVESLDRGIALPTITEAVFARYTSAEKELRTTLQKSYREKISVKKPSLNTFTKTLESALYSAIISSYAQGFHLIATAAREEDWQIDLGEVARIWQGGCIIRAKLLTTIHAAYQTKTDQKQHLFALKNIVSAMKKSRVPLRNIVSLTAAAGIPASTFAVSLHYFEAMTQANSSANMIQGLRDYFGAHTYERTDREGTYHTNWN